MLTEKECDALPRYGMGDLMRGRFPDKPFVADVHTFDIDETMAAMVRNCHPMVRGIVMVDRGGRRMREAVEAAALVRDIRILWRDRIADARGRPRDAPIDPAEAR